MRVLQINATANWGSTGKIAEQIGDAILSRGGESYIAYSRYAAESHSNLVKIGNPFTLYLHVLGARLFDASGMFAKHDTRRLIKTISDIKPDIIHLHNIHGYVLNYNILFEYLNKTDVKVVWTFHDFWAITGHCCHFIAMNCEKWKSVCDCCPLIREYPSSYIDFSKRNYNIKKRLFTSNNNLTIIPVSEWVEDNVRMSFLKDKPIEVIHNGIDLQVFKNIEYVHHQLLNLIDDRFVILGVASQWKTGKGIEDFIRLSGLLKEDEIIILVGVDKSLITSLPHNIIGYPHAKDQNELACIYNISSVVVSFSSAETFGMTIIEGMACGTPAVVYDNTAPPSIITPETGIVVPDKDVESAYNAIQEIKSKGKKHYSEHCIKHIKDNYDKDKCFSQYLDLYKRLLNDN